MHSVLFVCLGNICRSPLAEAVARDIAVKKGLECLVDSAGTGNWHIGEPPCENSQKIAAIHGIDISTMRARQVSKEDFERFEYIVALDESNKEALLRMGAKDVVKLGDFGYDGADVPDPYFFNGFEGFEEVYRMIEICVKNFIEQKCLAG